MYSSFYFKVQIGEHSNGLGAVWMFAGKIDILSITKLTSENHFWLVETFSIWFQNSLKDAYEVQLLVLFDSSNFRFKTSNSNF